MKPEQHKAAMERLHALLASMDVPDHRKRPQNRESLRWLARCLSDRNANHPSFKEAADLIDALGCTTTRPGHE